MNAYELFFKMTHMKGMFGWEEATATFTGERRPVVRFRGQGTQLLTHIDYFDPMYEYALRFYIGDKERISWFRFYPGPDPEPDEIRDTTIRIRYKKRRPWIIEAASVID